MWRSNGDLAAARALGEESLDLRRELGDRWGVALALEHLGIVAVALGDTVRARALHGESLILRRELGDKHGMADSLDQLAELTVAQGQPQRGARLRGAADALRQAHGLPRVPGGQVAHVRALAVLSAVLGEVDYAAAMQEGRTLSFEEAIALVLATEPAG